MSDNNNNININIAKAITSPETKYHYKPGTILYEEDIHYNIIKDANNIINTRNSNQESINTILENYRKNNIHRLYEEDVWS
jgi:hypothetical protein